MLKLIVEVLEVSSLLFWSIARDRNVIDICFLLFFLFYCLKLSVIKSYEI